ncbi:MAG: glycosyltransferase [Phycisphaerales bacterium]|nr:glycosyltransferase [Phycisphaerales bacterium]
MKRLLLAILTRATLFMLYGGFLTLLALLWPFAAAIRTRRMRTEADVSPREFRIVVIGTFYTRNWCISHLTPLSRAGNISSITAVVDGPIQPIERVRYVLPSAAMTRVFGRALTKLISALREASREQPDVVMGYHLLPNAMSALLVAWLVGARAGYQLTAGPIELIGGGSATENFFLKNLGGESRILELLASRIARCFDLLVVRGGRARRFLLDKGVRGIVRVIPGSLDLARFAPDDKPRDIDVISVCRLVAIKQPEHIIEALSRLRAKRPDFRAVILGEGPLRASLENRIRQLGLAHNVELVGHVEAVENYLRRSRVFLLTSRSEGLSIAMAEAMAAGVVPVVADVGELSDLARNGETGWVVPPGDFEEYAAKIADVLSSEQRWHDYSAAALHRAAANNSLASIATRWSRTIQDACDAETMRNAQTPVAPRWAISRAKLWQHATPRIRSAVTPLFHIAQPAAWLGADFRKRQAFVAQADRWPAERIREYQLRELRRTLTIAYERTEFYFDRFRECGFHPCDLRTLDDLARLPLLDRDAVRDHIDELQTIPRGRAGAEWVSTGGTSGEPLRLRMSLARSAIEFAYLVQSWSRAGYELGAPLAVFRGDVVEVDPRSGLRHSYDPILRRHNFSNFHMDDDSIAQYLRRIASIGPCYLLAYPSAITALIRSIERRGAGPPANIRGILAGSEMIYPADRAAAERALGVRYFSWYGQTEKVALAAECEHGTDMHLWPTYGLVELIDDDGRPVREAGCRGEIVGTSFLDRVTPLVRYRTGDYATFVGDRCSSCGREQLIVRDIAGHRTQEMLVAQDRSLISWTALNMHDNTFDNVRQFQFSQEEPGRAILRVLPAPGFGPLDIERIRDRLNRKLAGRLAFQVAIAEEIRLTPRGKTTYVDQRLDIERLSAAEVVRR